MDRPDSILAGWLHADETLMAAEVDVKDGWTTGEVEKESMGGEHEGDGRAPAARWEWTPPRLQLSTEDARMYRRELTGRPEPPSPCSMLPNGGAKQRFRQTLLRPFRVGGRGNRTKHRGGDRGQGTVEVDEIGYEIVKPAPAAAPPAPSTPTRRVLVRPSRSRKQSTSEGLSPPSASASAPIISLPMLISPSTTTDPHPHWTQNHLRPTRSLPTHSALTAIPSQTIPLDATSSRGRSPAFPPSPSPGGVGSAVRRQRSERSLRRLARQGRFTSEMEGTFVVGVGGSGEGGSDEEGGTEELTTPTYGGSFATSASASDPSLRWRYEQTPVVVKHLSPLLTTTAEGQAPPLARLSPTQGRSALAHPAGTSTITHRPAQSVALSDFFPSPTSQHPHAPPVPLIATHPPPAPLLLPFNLPTPSPIPPSRARTHTAPSSTRTSLSAPTTTSISSSPRVSTSTRAGGLGGRSPAFQMDWTVYETEPRSVASEPTSEARGGRATGLEEWQVGEIVRLRTTGGTGRAEAGAGWGDTRGGGVVAGNVTTTSGGQRQRGGGTRTIGMAGLGLGVGTKRGHWAPALGQAF